MHFSEKQMADTEMHLNPYALFDMTGKYFPWNAFIGNNSNYFSMLSSLYFII